ncbi:ankyrin repeat protein [Lactarius deliciosus]|nr:ankyrin repeat protein [Lactarius deliciosus]
MNRICDDQCTPLHVAQAQFRGANTNPRKTASKLLPERDSNVSARGKNKWTPSHAASYYGRPEIVRLLLDRGAEAKVEADNGDTSRTYTYEPQEDGVYVARLILERGADVNKQRRNDHCTALNSASYRRKIDVVQLLLEHGASTNVEASTGATPLHSAS